MNEKTKITIEVDKNIVSDLADILCFFCGYNEAKGEDWKHNWLNDSIQSLRELRIEIEKELKKTK